MGAPLFPGFGKGGCFDFGIDVDFAFCRVRAVYGFVGGGGFCGAAAGALAAVVGGGVVGARTMVECIDGSCDVSHDPPRASIN